MTRGVGRLEEVSTRADDGATIRAWLALPQGQGPHPLLVFVHGMGSNFYRSGLKKAFLEAAPAHGLAVLSFNNRGAERGTEDEPFRMCLPDLDAAAALGADRAEVNRARRALALRWIDVGEERLRGGSVESAAQAVEEARKLDAATPGIAELQERVRVAARP